MKKWLIAGIGALMVGSFLNARRARRGGAATVLYDGACPLCRRTVARLRRWDTRGALSMMDARDTAAVAQQFPDLPPDPDLREMRLVFPDGKILGGFDAARALSLLLPPLRPLALLLYLPGLAPIGRAVYRFIAAHRPQTLHCTDACVLPE